MRAPEERAETVWEFGWRRGELRAVVRGPVGEIIANSAIGVISAGAGIDDDRFAAERGREVQGIEMTVRRHGQIAERRGIEAKKPVVGIENGVAGGEDLPLVFLWHGRFGEIAEPELERGALGGVVEPAVPFARGVLFFEKKRCDPGVVAIAEIPRIVFAFDRSVEMGGAGEAICDFGRDGDVGGFEGADGLKTEFPREEMVTERLLVVAAVGGELEERFAFEELCDLRERRAELREVGPAGKSDDEAGEFADEMIVGGGTE